MPITRRTATHGNRRQTMTCEVKCGKRPHTAERMRVKHCRRRDQRPISSTTAIPMSAQARPRTRFDQCTNLTANRRRNPAYREHTRVTHSRGINVRHNAPLTPDRVRHPPYAGVQVQIERDLTTVHPTINERGRPIQPLQLRPEKRTPFFQKDLRRTSTCTADWQPRRTPTSR